MLLNRLIGLVLCLLCGTALASPKPAAQPRLYITTEVSAPSSMLDQGRVVGIATDKVREAMHRAGVAYTIDMLPWKRAYAAALQRPNGCVYSTTRTPEREAFFKWVGPTDIAQWVLMARADRKLQLRSLDDARGLRIGTYNGDARDAFLRARGLSTDPTSNELSNPQKLILGRIDLWAASLRSGSTVLTRYGYDKKIVPVLVFNEIGVYLACNRKVPDEVIGRLNQTFDQMAQDGTGRRIERRYERWVPAGRVR